MGLSKLKLKLADASLGTTKPFFFLPERQFVAPH